LNVYIARLLAFDGEKQDVLQKMLSFAPIQRLIFPAKVYTTGDDSEIMNSTEQLVELFLQKQAEKKPIAVLTLYAENGLELSFTFYFAGANLPTVILLKFTGEHVQNNLVSLKILSRVVEQSMENFSLNHATVYDDATIPYPQGLKYFNTPQMRRYPIQLGWLYYFGHELVEFIGQDKFEGIQGYTKRLHDSGGITLTYEKDFDALDENQQFVEAKAIEQLGLSRL
jgi:hypothetical protein